MLAPLRPAGREHHFRHGAAQTGGLAPVWVSTQWRREIGPLGRWNRVPLSGLFTAVNEAERGVKEQEETALAVRAWEPSDHRPCSVPRLRFSVSPYPSTCWMVQRLTSRRLASSRWLTPFDRSSRMYSRCCSVRTGRRPGKRSSVRAFAWPATERSLIEFRHHSLNVRACGHSDVPAPTEGS